MGFVVSGAPCLVLPIAPMNGPARIVYVIVCLAGMAGFVWFVDWLIYAHSKDFGSGVAVGVGMMIALNLAHHLLTRGRSSTDALD